MQVNHDIITPDFIRSLSYPDFVGFINQWNVLPGAHNTLTKWIKFGDISKESRILQFACTTGFQSREISSRTGCSGEAFDLSKYAIKAAEYNLKHYAPKANINYHCMDGHLYEPSEKFSHVVIGAGLKFFKDQDKVLKKCLSCLDDGGLFLASPFYIKTELPGELVKLAEQTFGITPTTERYKSIMAVYEGLDILYEDRNDLIPETNEELRHYCKSTIDRACNIHNINSNELYDAMYERLFTVKNTSNLLRPYQSYNVLVLRYNQQTYPARYVELF